MAGPGAELRYEEAPRQAMQRPMPKDCWAVNACARPAGHWGDAEWYDLQLERRLPLVKPMLNEVVCALPPLGSGRVCDVGCGTGRCAVEIRKAACLRKCAKGVFVTPGKRSVGVIADPASDPAARPAGQLEAADAAAAYLAELGGLDDARLAALRERLGAGVALLDVAADDLAEG